MINVSSDLVCFFRSHRVVRTKVSLHYRQFWTSVMSFHLKYGGHLGKSQNIYTPLSILLCLLGKKLIYYMISISLKVLPIVIIIPELCIFSWHCTFIVCYHHVINNLELVILFHSKTAQLAANGSNKISTIAAICNTLSRLVFEAERDISALTQLYRDWHFFRNPIWHFMLLQTEW